jgi:hypothetical protein
MPKITYESMDSVPAEFKDIAKAEDGKVTIDVSPTAKLNEFRERNVALSAERDKAVNFTAKLQTELGFDPEKLDEFLTGFTGLKEVAQQVEDGKLVKDTSLKEALEARTAEMRTAHENAMREAATREQNLKSQNADLTNKFNRSIVDREIMMAASDPKSGVRPDAMKAVLTEAYDTFKVDENGKLVPKDHEGNVRYGADGATPMSIGEWMKGDLLKNAPYVFKSSEGGGAQGGGGQGGYTAEQLSSMSPEQLMDAARAGN